MMTLDEIDAELARRADMERQIQQVVEEGDLLEAGLMMFRRNPEKILSDSATFARLMELHEKRTVVRAASPSGVTEAELAAMSLTDLKRFTVEQIYSHSTPEQWEAFQKVLSKR